MHACTTSQRATNKFVRSFIYPFVRLVVGVYIPPIKYMDLSPGWTFLFLLSTLPPRLHVMQHFSKNATSKYMRALIHPFVSEVVGYIFPPKKYMDFSVHGEPLLLPPQYPTPPRRPSAACKLTQNPSSIRPKRTTNIPRIKKVR